MATIDDLILDALIQQESGGDPDRVGKAGEIGLAQIKPSTAAQYGVSADALRHPEVNRMVARRYLDDLMRHYQGDLAMALAAYNAGPGNVDRGLIPQSTRQYVSNILARSGTRGGALPPSRAPEPVPGLGPQPWRMPASRPAPAVPAGMVALASRAAQPFRAAVAPRGVAAPVGIGGLPTRTPAAPSITPGVPNLERATGLLEERMHILLISLGIPQRIARFVAGAYASAYRLPFARPRLLQALLGRDGLDGLVNEDQPKILQLIRMMRLGGT